MTAPQEPFLTRLFLLNDDCECCTRLQHWRMQLGFRFRHLASGRRRGPASRSRLWPARLAITSPFTSPLADWRLFQVAPGLAMSRSIGDAVGAMVGVTAEPEVSSRAVAAGDTFVLIASDGVWEFLESSDATRCR